MEGETMSKDTNMGNSRAGFTSKPPTGYHHHSHHHHQRNPSVDSIGHNHSQQHQHQYQHQHQHQHQQQQQQQQYYLKPRLPAEQYQQQSFHSTAPSLHRTGSNGGSYSSYLPPQSNHHHPNNYHQQYGTQSRSTTPGVRAVVTHSFSMEEEQREDGSSRYGHRGQSQRDPSGYSRDEYRSPAVEFHPERSVREEQSFQPPPSIPPSPHFSNRRDYLYGGSNRELPPVLERDEIRLPPRDVMREGSGDSSLKRTPSSPSIEPHASTIERTLSSGLTGGPLKRSFWHHSRPSGEANSNSGEAFGNESSSSTSQTLPQEFMPPKRKKTSQVESEESSGSLKREKEYTVTARSHISNDDPKQQQQPPLPPRPHNQQPVIDNNSVRGTESAGVRESPPGDAQFSPSDSWFNSRSMSWEAREDYFRRDPRSTDSWSSRSPSGRDGPASTGNGSHWMEAPYMPSPRPRHQGERNPYDTPLPSWDAYPERWGQNHSPHIPYLAWSTGNSSNDGFMQQQQQHQRNESILPEGFNDDHRSPMNFAMQNMPPFHQHHGLDVVMGSPPMPTTSSAYAGKEPSRSTARVRPHDTGGRKIMNKNGPIKLLALPEDRISLSETLCIVREVSHNCTLLFSYNYFSMYACSAIIDVSEYLFTFVFFSPPTLIER